ncbi:MAG: HAMP domain-containing protein, partial [Ruminococcaceae bacterium]|nr:HAMP domain-containing protein [Oscillospiraceae bacterium]
QIQMLNYFYQNAKFKEFEETSNNIIQNLNNVDVLKESVDEYSETHYMNIWVFSADKHKLREIVSVSDYSNEAVVFLMKNLPMFYERALDNDGRYIAMLSYDYYGIGSDIKVIKDNAGDGSSYPILMGRVGNIDAIYVQIHQTGDSQYVIIQKSDLTPMQVIVNTLKDQFTITGIALLLFALIFASLMSKFITHPIIKMNESAKKLAKGEYDADFSASGYREINELAATLDYAAKELSQNDRLQKDLISNISHDLRTPLTMIKGYSEVMRDIPGENTPENIQVIIDETSRLTELVNDMLDLSKIQSGTRKPEFREFSITDMIRQTLKRYEKLTVQDGYKIDFEADCDVNVMADSVMILQVIYNLINNAINYTGEDKHVIVRQTVNNGKVKISVIDTGAGISNEDLPLIWDRYYKVDKVHRRATVGTGLGLSIVKGCLETHNAAYGVKSSLNQGSTFWFELTVFDSSINVSDY